MTAQTGSGQVSFAVVAWKAHARFSTPSPEGTRRNLRSDTFPRSTHSPPFTFPGHSDILGGHWPYQLFPSISGTCWGLNRPELALQEVCQGTGRKAPAALINGEACHGPCECIYCRAYSTSTEHRIPHDLM